ncbi:YlzJ-like family protein [Defluviitalea phaphyphila]|uniref:YlzJ-like family protein n=1 Tax=Defluviitalea phaphyphila TaxID=1473580 RepID=UPI00072FC13F|nr:YlzJ-like family protein [Defluviitalea phaphyphila]
MIYSIIPNDVIFRDLKYEKNYEREEIEYKGCILQVSSYDNGYKIQRIISTNPIDYLNKEIQPGNVIYLNNRNKF